METCGPEQRPASRKLKADIAANVPRMNTAYSLLLFFLLSRTELLALLLLFLLLLLSLLRT
jgi:hypothetical protein